MRVMASAAAPAAGLRQCQPRPRSLQPRALTNGFCSGINPAGARWLHRAAAGGRQQRRQRQQAAPTALLLPPDRDEAKEERLKRFRITYTFENWTAHRSVTRYWRHFRGLFSSRIIAGIQLPLLLVFLEATLVVLYERLLTSGLLPAGFRSIQVRAPMLFSLSSFALSLLLVFRTNQSYARFHEARRLWSMTVNRCRDAMRQLVSYLGPQQAGLLSVLARWFQAFPWILKNHVREHKCWQEDLGDLLQPAELQAVRDSPNPPLTALQIITEVLDRASISAKQRLQVDKCVTDLSDVVGACERILKTPIPVSYTRHTCRYLVIWLALLPLSIYNQCGWVTVFTSVVLGFFLLSIEEIGVSIEEPFLILPLEDINRAANIDLAVRQQAQAILLVDAATGTQRPAHHMAPALPME